MPKHKSEEVECLSCGALCSGTFIEPTMGLIEEYRCAECFIDEAEAYIDEINEEIDHAKKMRDRGKR